VNFAGSASPMAADEAQCNANGTRRGVMDDAALPSA